LKQTSPNYRLVSALSLLCFAGLLAGCPEKEKKAEAPPPPAVQVATVLQRDVPVHVEAIGELRGNTEIEIRARVEGFIESVDYKEGTLVKKDQVLYKIDARPFQAKLSVAKASQAEAEAQLARTHQDVVRYEPLVAKNAISRQEYETAVALEKAAQAGVDATKAQVEQAQIDLSYTTVTAPEEGLAGRTEVYAGTLVGRGQSTLLTRISRTDPIHVRFSFPERDYLEMARKRGTGVSAEPGANVPFELVLPDGSVHPQPGKLVFVDRNVDARTGTIMAEAAFANPGGILRPGQYARARATLETRSGAILVPQRAVKELQGVFSVMVVGADDSAEQRVVMPAERIGSLWVIASGLKAGEKIIVEGLQKARAGSKVKPTLVELNEKGEVPAEKQEAPPEKKDAAPGKSAPAKPGEKH
jgi:membrane fusion protein (multidrug efflux system)